MKNISILILAALLPVWGYADELPTKKRCDEDKLSEDALMRGRNEWAHRCGYVKAADRDAMNQIGFYFMFDFHAPSDPNAPCVQGKSIVAACPKGCYASGESLLMGDGKYLPIDVAAKDSVPSVSAAKVNERGQVLDFSEQPLDYYTAGKTKNPLKAITTETDLSVKVTKDHPMIRDTGEIVRADKLKVGDLLLVAKGDPAKIKSIEDLPYKGLVWNLAPKSLEKENNILSAQGILTGSVRFQNQWADDTFRLLIRKNADTEGM